MSRQISSIESFLTKIKVDVLINDFPLLKF